VRVRPQRRALPEPTPLAGLPFAAIPLAARQRRAAPLAPSLPLGSRFGFDHSDW